MKHEIILCFLFISACTLFVDSGYFCPSRYPRPSTQYYYDPFTQRCQTFYYRGCGGTPNRFSSRYECLRSCGCFSDIDFGNSCPYNSYIFFQQYTIRYAFNKYTGTCQPFRFSACNGGNDNNFQTQLECQTTCAPSSADIDAPPFRHNFAASSNSIQQGTARALNMRLPEAGSSSNIRSSSQMPTEGNVPLNTESQTNFGSSSIMAMQSSQSNINSGVMGFPAIQNNFGSSALSAGNSAMNGRLNQMPSPLNPSTAQMMNLNGQIIPAGGNRMQNRMISRKGNKIYW